MKNIFFGSFLLLILFGCINDSEQIYYYDISGRYNVIIIKQLCNPDGYKDYAPEIAYCVSNETYYSTNATIACQWVSFFDIDGIKRMGFFSDKGAPQAKGCYRTINNN